MNIKCENYNYNLVSVYITILQAYCTVNKKKTGGVNLTCGGKIFQILYMGDIIS